MLPTTTEKINLPCFSFLPHSLIPVNSKVNMHHYRLHPTTTISPKLEPLHMLIMLMHRTDSHHGIFPLLGVVPVNSKVNMHHYRLHPTTTISLKLEPLHMLICSCLFLWRRLVFTILRSTCILRSVPIHPRGIQGSFPTSTCESGLLMMLFCWFGGRFRQTYHTTSLQYTGQCIHPAPKSSVLL